MSIEICIGLFIDIMLSLISTIILGVDVCICFFFLFWNSINEENSNIFADRLEPIPRENPSKTLLKNDIINLYSLLFIYLQVLSVYLV